MDMPGCHEMPADSQDAPLPDCCDGMDGVYCGMDCGTAGSAVSQLAVIPALPGHGAYVAAGGYAAPEPPASFLYKPPRTP